MDSVLVSLVFALVLIPIVGGLGYLCGRYDERLRHEPIFWQDLSPSRQQWIIDNGGVDEHGVRWV